MSESAKEQYRVFEYCCASPDAWIVGGLSGDNDRSSVMSPYLEHEILVPGKRARAALAKHKEPADEQA